MIDSIIENQRVNNDVKSSLNSMVLNFNYFNDTCNAGGFKLFISAQNELTVFIVSPLGIINPRAKAEEIYYTIVNFASNNGINMGKSKVLLDLLEYTGIESKYIFEWNFAINNGKLSDSLLELDLYNPLISCAIDSYLNSSWSIFVDSTLNSKQKIEILAYALSETCLDDISQEHMVKNFKLSLKKARDKNKTFKNFIFETNIR